MSRNRKYPHEVQDEDCTWTFDEDHHDDEDELELDEDEDELEGADGFDEEEPEEKADG